MAKGIRFTVALLTAVLCAFPLLAAVDMFLKFDGIQGDSTQPAHAGWFEVASFSWGMSQPGAAVPPAISPGAASCANARLLMFTRKGTASERLTQLCKQRAQLPSLTVDIGGERHMLQNVSFQQCTSQPAGGENAFESYSLNFARCATHANAAMARDVQHKVDLGDIKMKVNLNAILIGLTPRPEAFQVMTLNFMGPTSARLVGKSSVNDGTLMQAFQTRQPIPTLTLTLNNGQKWTFTGVLVSSYSPAPNGAQAFSLNFTKVDGPPTGFQAPQL